MKEIEYKKLTIVHIDLLTKVGSPVATGEESLQALLDCIYVTNVKISEALKSYRNDTWYEDVITFNDQFTEEQLEDYSNKFMEEQKLIHESKVEVVPTEDLPEKKE